MADRPELELVGKVALEHALSVMLQAETFIREYRERVIKGEITGRLLEGDFELVRELQTTREHFAPPYCYEHGSVSPCTHPSHWED